MSSDTTSAAEAAKPMKRTTRSSIRHSLNLASVGKALADVMSKDGKEKNTMRRKSSVSSKDTQSRRASTIGFSRGSSGLDPVVERKLKSPASPDQQTVNQSRRSSSSLQRPGRHSVDESGLKTVISTTPTAVSALNRTSSVLRPRNAVAGSALPKYRPKSVIIENTTRKPASPVCAGTRRKHSSSEEDREGSSSATTLQSPMDKASRPISPIPRRAARTGLSPTLNIEISPSHPRKASAAKESPTSSSTPTRPKKTPKPSASPITKKSGLPKPSPHDVPSRASSASPRTPILAKSTARLVGALKSGRVSPSPLRSSSASNGALSSRRSSKSLKGASDQNTPTASSFFAQSTPQKLEEGVSSDSIGDVEFMLAAVASPTAPTPAIPRLRTMNLNQGLARTPSRSSLHPPRSTLGLSLLPNSATGIHTPSSRRSSPDRRPAIERSSVAAWEKLADLSAEINATELGGLITEVDAPFNPMTPGLLSPSPSIMRLDSDRSDAPESPTPLSLPSPGGYTSISQVLLPNVTPSPAMHAHANFYMNNTNSGLEVPSVDSATMTLLKLQLASMENLAKERLTQITQLEEQMYMMKELQRQDEQELAVEVAQLENRLREALAARDRRSPEPDHASCRAVLQETLSRQSEFNQKAVSDAIAKAAEEERIQRERFVLRMESQRKLSAVAESASRQWLTVRNIADTELEFIAANRETLAVLSAGLAVYEVQVQSFAACTW